jgi:hypothetical protein
VEGTTIEANLEPFTSVLKEVLSKNETLQVVRSLIAQSTS